MGSDKIVSMGKWDFMPEGESAKNKERVTLEAQHVTEGSLYDFHIFNQYRATFTYKIKELRNKEMVLVASSQTPPDLDGDYVLYTIEYLFVQD